MFDVERRFRVSIFALVSLSAVMLALAEGAVFPNSLTVPLAVVAYSLAERKRKWQLSTLWANGLGIFALLIAAWEWLGEELTVDLEAVMLSRLLAGTHLLIYLTWIVLFQHKEARHYWRLFALSVLQVAVGSVLTSQGVYGFLIFVYLFAAVWTLSLFTMYQTRLQLRRPAEVSATGASGRETRAPEVFSEMKTASGILQPSHVVSENGPRSWREPWIDLRFLGGALAAGTASTVVAIIFFLLVPRVWIGQLPIAHGGTGGLARRHVTGFTEEVQLGSMGQILESNARVLFVRMYDESNTEIDVNQYARGLGYDEPLFRGAVLGTYENGRWEAGEMGRERDVVRSGDISQPSVRQECRLTLNGTRYLFAIHPVLAGRPRGERGAIGFQPFSGMLLRWPRSQPEVQYTIYSLRDSSTPAPPQHATMHPVPGVRDRVQEQIVRMEMMAQCRRFPNWGGKLTRLRALAHRVAGQDAALAQRPPAAEMARRLEEYLRDSGEYGYTLNSSIIEPSDDPVEDFLFNRKEGHCEYFASALALMLRAVGIPSRLVNGFKGGEVNRLTGEFYVEERHAHAWVEAFVDGKWVTLDATPAAARSRSVAGLAPSVLSWDDLTSMIREQWSSNFVLMSESKQQQQFYQPMKQFLSTAWNSIRGDGQAAAGGPGSLREFLSSPENWFSWQGAVVTALLLTALLALISGVRRMLRSRQYAQAGQRRDGTAAGPRVEFYERFRAVCRACGLVRGETETEREFLLSLNLSLQPELSEAGLGGAPTEIVDSFYDVRFGRRPLDAGRAHQLDAQLQALERLAADVKRGRSQAGC